MGDSIKDGRGGSQPPVFPGWYQPLPKRKPNRLKQFDYSNPGAYFVTICTNKRQNLFGSIDVGAALSRPLLSPLGIIVEEEINRLSKVYSVMYVDCYVIMPNHIHMIIVIGASDYGRLGAAPTTNITLSQIVGGLKRQISLRAEFSPWQKSFHDHIIRNDADYEHIAQYIQNNPLSWEDDCYYNM